MALPNVLVEPTIGEIEQTVASGLEALRNAPLSAEITAALRFLTPAGYRPIAQFEEDGRKKRNNAAASNWNPETGEIVIYFERIADADQASAGNPPRADSQPSSSGKREFFAKMQRHVQAGLQEDPVSIPRAERREATREAIQVTLAEPKVSDEEIEQLCIVLADAEKAGKAFIALTWFRDQELPARGYAWAESPAYRRAVLAKAFDVGAILTSRIPNPKSPHPTTTIKLNRESKYAQVIAPRYQPIQLRGEGLSASDILLRDRGRL
jgi:hypothetical protein